jgi:hypothetical protein
MVGMDGADEVFSLEGAMAPQEIIERFKRVFGREMTPDERKSLFLPPDASAQTAGK